MQLRPENAESIENVEKVIDDLKDTVDDLREENAHLRKELALSSPLNVNALVINLTEYLDWVDAPNINMGTSGVRLVQTQLRSALNDALTELR
jgi:hypothetical protein|tara:strand:+ start:1848 stop:2126 length:279 start_codon:yes stop_codon:yes gene_type:complete